jgi:hypothetical protein
LSWLGLIKGFEIRPIVAHPESQVKGAAQGTSAGLGHSLGGGEASSVTILLETE